MERIELYPIFNRYTVYNDHYDGELDGSETRWAETVRLPRYCRRSWTLQENTKVTEAEMKIGFPGMPRSLRLSAEK